LIARLTVGSKSESEAEILRAAGSIDSDFFGQVTAAREARIMQLGAKFTFLKWQTERDIALA